jgi:hypothetical protein
MEVVAYQVSASQQNIHMLNGLLQDWLGLLGSSIRQHPALGATPTH